MTDSLFPESAIESDEATAAKIAADEKAAYNKAIKLLARREHSQNELRLKLGKAGFDEIVIDNSLQKLVDRGFQSDHRFAELFVEQRFNKGYGERDILAKLGQRGISRQLSDAALADFVKDANVDWYAQAVIVLSARFGLPETPLSETHSETDNGRGQAYEQAEARQRKRKQWGNYLLRRGFSNDQVIFALENPGYEQPGYEQ